MKQILNLLPGCAAGCSALFRMLTYALWPLMSALVWACYHELVACYSNVHTQNIQVYWPSCKYTILGIRQILSVAIFWWLANLDILVCQGWTVLTTTMGLNSTSWSSTPSIPSLMCPLTKTVEFLLKYLPATDLYLGIC